MKEKLNTYCVMLSKVKGDMVIPKFVFFGAACKAEAKMIGDLVCYYKNSVVLFECDI